jgi:superfamily II DNA or RNA helicase
MGLPLNVQERQLYERDHACFTAFRRSVQALDPDADWKALVVAAAGSEAGRAAMTAWRRVRKLLALTRAKLDAVGTLIEKHRDRKILIFTADNAAAYRIARTHLVMPLTCDVGRAERDEALEKFRAGALRALVSSRVLNEGLDVPDADVGIVVGGAQGSREHVQRIGRVLRPAPGKRAVVYELVSRGTIEVRSAFHRRDGLGRHASPAA